FGITLAAGKQRCSAFGAKRSENSRPRISVCVENACQSFHGADCVRGKRHCHSRFATRDVLAVSTVTTHRDESVEVHFVSNLTVKTASRSSHAQLISFAPSSGILDGGWSLKAPP